MGSSLGSAMSSVLSICIGCLLCMGEELHCTDLRRHVSNVMFTPAPDDATLLRAKQYLKTHTGHQDCI